MLSKAASTPTRQEASSPRPPNSNRTPRRTPQRSSQQNHTPTRSRAVTNIHNDPLKHLVPPRPPNFSLQSASTSTNPEEPEANFLAYNPEKEPIKAYLRIRPPLLATDQSTSRNAIYISNPFTSNDTATRIEGSFSTTPYLQIADNSEVCMTPPEDSNAYRTRNRAPERYRFTKIFTDNVSQQEFFNKTTLPLLKDVLRGENALIFAYGVTNSGKTYSIMGTRTNPGLLPRTLDVLFNTIKDYTSDSKLKPVMHSLVQAYENKSEENRYVLEQAGSFENAHLGSSNCDMWDGHHIPTHPDTTVIPIDDKYEYGIWVSFAEIYTERIYDLLVAPDKQRKRKSLALKYEFRSGHKYIAGLTEVKVKTIEEAYAILREGQRNRAIFSTLMNQTSSRSHSIFTIAIVRVPIYENDYVIEDPSYAVVSKMSIVDLAGSERYRNTLNSGQRLKEAGNINKSLMVLGQCMETLRLNQLKAAMGKRCAIVPFRHSKLTELFKSSFEGDGKAVMVVNVNPTETGFDENSQVMKFAAVAKDVATWRRIHPTIDLHGISTAAKRRRTKEKRITHRSNHGGPHTLAEDMDICQSMDEEDISEEYDDDDDNDDDDELEDPFVDNLIAQWADLRDKWTDAETRCATMESTIRQQVSKEMDIELRKMEEIYMARMTRENNSTMEDIRQRLNHPEIADGSEAAVFLNNLCQRQEILTAELDKMRTRVQDNDITKQTLLEKMAGLEQNRSKDQGTIHQLMQDIQQRDLTIQDLRRQLDSKSGGTCEPMDEDNPFIVAPLIQKEPSMDQSSPETETPGPSSVSLHAQDISTTTKASTLDTPPFVPSSSIHQHTNKRNHSSFDEFLDLRKRLRRSIFKSEEYSSDADAIMAQVEAFKDVTFDMVKESNMGKLLKLISQRQFKQDRYHLNKRAKALFKRYIKLSISTLAPPVHPFKQDKHTKRDSLIMVSVDAGKEEDLISEMRDAMDVLQDENRKLKLRIKAMKFSQSRLTKAFDHKPSDLLASPKHPTDNTTTMIMMKDDPIKTQNDQASSNNNYDTHDDYDVDDSSDDAEDVNDDNGNNLLLSPVLGESAMMMENEDDLHRDEQQPKRRRKLRIRQGGH